MSNYRQMINGFGLLALGKPCHIPDFHLMVGSAEDLSSQPVMIFEDAIPKQVATCLPNIKDMTYEDVQADLAAGKLTIDDFFTNVYPLGDPIM